MSMVTEEARKKILALSLVGFTAPAAIEPKLTEPTDGQGRVTLTKNGRVKSGMCKVGLAHKTGL